MRIQEFVRIDEFLLANPRVSYYHTSMVDEQIELELQLELQQVLQ